jgi:hypothetical protein
MSTTCHCPVVPSGSKGENDGPVQREAPLLYPRPRVRQAVARGSLWAFPGIAETAFPCRPRLTSPRRQAFPIF